MALVAWAWAFGALPGAAEWTRAPGQSVEPSGSERRWCSGLRAAC